MTNACENRIATGTAARRTLWAAASLVVAALGLAAPAEAKVPPFSAACPGRIDVQADNGGRILINGQPARVRPSGDRSYEARLGNITVSVLVGPGGRLSVASRMRGPDAVCMVKPLRSEPPRREPPRSDNGPVERLAAACRAEASARFRVRPMEITVNRPLRDGRRFIVPGSFRDRGHPAAFTCTFDANGRLLSLR